MAGVSVVAPHQGSWKMGLLRNMKVLQGKVLSGQNSRVLPKSSFTLQGMTRSILNTEGHTIHDQLPLSRGEHVAFMMCVHMGSVASVCLTLYDPIDSSPPGSSVHGVFQPRILEWVSMPHSRDLPGPGIFLAQGSSWPGGLSDPGIFLTRGSSWPGGLPGPGIFLTRGSSWPGDLPDPGIEPVSPASPAIQADSLPAEPRETLN